MYDASGYLQGEIDRAEDAAAVTPLPQADVYVPGNESYGLTQKLRINSDLNTRLITNGGMAELRWIGPTMDPAQEDGDAAMVHVTGTDHSFGGLEGFFIDGQWKANFGVYFEGACNTGFRLRRLHLKHSQLDGIFANNKQHAGQTQLILESLTSYPSENRAGQIGSCGRYPIHIAVGSNSGMVHLRDVNVDTGGAGGIGITAADGATVAGEAVYLSNVRVETYGPAKNAIVTDYGLIQNSGVITLAGVEAFIGDAGSINALVRNNGAAKPVINFSPFTPQSPMAFIYDDIDAGRRVAYDAKWNGVCFAINQAAHAGRLPCGPSLPSSPNDGDFTFDPITGRLIARSVGRTLYQTLGKDPHRGPTISPCAIGAQDHDTVVHNNNIGAMMAQAGSIAADGLSGITVTLYAATGGVITFKPDPLDYAGTKPQGVSLVSSGSAGDSITLHAGIGGNKWAVLHKIGNWS